MRPGLPLDVVFEFFPRNDPAPYPPEFRAEAVRLSLQRGERWKDVAVELGVSAETLRLWRKQAAVDAKLADGLTTAEQQELRELRRLGGIAAADLWDDQAQHALAIRWCSSPATMGR